MFDYLKTFYQAMKLGVYYNQVADKTSAEHLRQEMLEAMNVRS
jgi:hypothetical protein